MKKLVLLLIISSFLFAKLIIDYDTPALGEFDKVKIVYDKENGEEKTYGCDSKDSGTCTKLVSTAQYKDGKFHGLSRSYDQNGNLTSETEYKYGKRNGVYKKYDQQGYLIEEIHWKDDKQHGFSRRYDQQGHLIEETEWKNGSRVDGWIGIINTLKLVSLAELFWNYPAIVLIIAFILSGCFILTRDIPRVKSWTVFTPALTWTLLWLLLMSPRSGDPLGDGLAFIFIASFIVPILVIITILSMIYLLIFLYKQR